MPRISVVELPSFFFLACLSSSASRRNAPPLPLTGRLPEPPCLEDDSSMSPSSPSIGSSTTKRYLHFGQSIFLPISLGSRTGTIASQLGHCCLKFVVVAIKVSGKTRRHGRGKCA